MSKLPSFRCPVGFVWIGLSATLAAQTPWTPATREVVPEILSSGLTPGGFRIEIAAPPGDFRLERSTTLLQNSWQNLGTIDPIFGIGERTDAGALSLPKAFYRVAGSFDETDMKLVSFDTALSSATFDGFDWGGLWTRQARENLLFQSGEPGSGLAMLLDGDDGGFIVEPNLAPPIFTSVDQWSDTETVPLTITDNTWLIDDPSGDIELIPVETGGHARVGIATDEFTFSDEGFSSTERSQETLWVISKSQNAQPSDLAGNWGFVRILSDAYENIDMIDGISFLDGIAFPTSIAAGPNPLTSPVASIEGFEIEHAWGFLPAGVDSLFYADNPNTTVSLNLAPNGEVTIAVPGENPFNGIVSPSAKLLVAAQSDPDIASDPDNVGQDFGVVQWLVGVKRTNTPVLAGKTYRVIRQGWWVEGDFFEIDRGGASDQLVFNSNGTSVTRSTQFNSDFVSFNGGFGSGSDNFNITMSVTVDTTQGLIRMEGQGLGGDISRAIGYAQQGSGLLVLVDCYQTTDAAGLGLMIAVEDP